MEKRFNVLRIIATIYKVIGVLIAVLGVLAFLGICAAGLLGSSNRSFDSPFGAAGVVGALASGIVFLIAGALYALILYGAGEGIYLLLALEENTRQTAQAIQNLRPPSESTLSVAPPTTPSMTNP